MLLRMSAPMLMTLCQITSALMRRSATHLAATAPVVLRASTAMFRPTTPYQGQVFGSAHMPCTTAI